MPVNCKLQHETTARHLLSALQRWCVDVSTTKLLVRQQLILVKMQRMAARRDRMGVQRLMAVLMVLASSAVLNAAMELLPRHHSGLQGPLKHVQHFTNAEFNEQFRFQKGKFYQVLWGMLWLDADGSSKILKIGRPHHQFSIQ